MRIERIRAEGREKSLLGTRLRGPTGFMGSRIMVRHHCNLGRRELIPELQDEHIIQHLHIYSLYVSICLSKEV